MIIKVDYEGIAATRGECEGIWFGPSALKKYDKTKLPLHFNHGRSLKAHAHLSVSERGLHASGKFFLDTSKPRDADLYYLLNHGCIRGLSITFAMNQVDLPGTARVLQNPIIREVSLAENPKDRAACFSKLFCSIVSPLEAA